MERLSGTIGADLRDLPYTRFLDDDRSGSFFYSGLGYCRHFKYTTKLLLIIFLFSFSGAKATDFYSPWEHASFYLKEYKGEFKSTFLDVLVGTAYWSSVLSKRNPSDLGWVIYESLFVVGSFPKALARTFEGYPSMTVEKKSFFLDDLSPVLWNKLYKYESYFIPQIICNDLCMIAESFIDEISTLKQEKDSKLLNALLYDNSEILRAYYQYREYKNATARKMFLDAITLSAGKAFKRSGQSDQ